MQPIGFGSINIDTRDGMKNYREAFYMYVHGTNSVRFKSYEIMN